MARKEEGQTPSCPSMSPAPIMTTTAIPTCSLYSVYTLNITHLFIQKTFIWPFSEPAIPKC